MLRDEEREALQYFNTETKTEAMHYGAVLVKLIEKQSKEIEELKEKDDANLAYYDQIYQNGIYTGQKAVEDKIKAKIEELEKDLKEYENGQEWEIQDEIRGQIDILQSLLEKE